MNFRHFYILVGLPGVGKSTWIKKNITDLYEYNAPLVLSSDTIIEEMCAQKGLTYNEGFADFIKPATKLFNQAIDEAFEKDQNIMIDRTNLSVKSRKTLIDKVPPHYILNAIVFTCSEDVHAKRLAGRPGKIIPAHILKSMKESYQAPIESEGFASVTYINTD
jgi:predicted kinase